jgi:hypothetical protein
VAWTGRLVEDDLDEGTREELLRAFRDWHRGASHREGGASHATTAPSALMRAAAEIDRTA